MRIAAVAVASVAVASASSSGASAFVPSAKRAALIAKTTTTSLSVSTTDPSTSDQEKKSSLSADEKFAQDAKALMESMSGPPSTNGNSSAGDPNSKLPKLGDDGIYHIVNGEQHKAFLAANPDKLIVIKFFAPWCRACKGLEPKFLQIVHDEKYKDLPIVFADLTVQHNKDFVKSLGVLALPSMHFYAGSDGLVENFPCGPSKVPILKRKLTKIINERVDAKTLELKPAIAVDENGESAPCTERGIAEETAAKTELSVGGVIVSEDQMKYLRNDVPFFKDLTDDEFYGLMKKAKLQTFEEGAIIMRQGKPGRLFYVIESGEVEISVKTAFEDPLTTPSSYLGAVFNRLTKNNFFGERALITGEPRAATIRAAEKTRCFAFDIADIPASSVLSGKADPTSERLQEVNDKYGVDVYDIDLIKDQFTSANVENQRRGSVNSPEFIAGVDDDSEIPIAAADGEEGIEERIHVTKQDMIIPLLVRFKLIRHAARCFDYIMHTKPKWGDPGELRRRTMLVNRLTEAQRAEFRDTFKMIDMSGDNVIELLELKRFLESIGEEKTDDELMELINKGDPSVDGNTSITYNDFMGIMAEAEFYHLFKDTFSALDLHNSGFVKAKDLDRVLCGVRDLISDDRMSVIDVEDKEMMINYDQFSKMLLGTI